MKSWLKAQLHIHIKGDPIDKFIKHSLKELIDKSKNKNFDILAVTCHEKIIEYSEKELDYAEKQGIILIRGVERNIEGKDVLILNPPKEVMTIKKIKELKTIKQKHSNILIGAPHPFYKFHSLGNLIDRHADIFDFFEYSFFYPRLFNLFNKKTEKLAKKHNKTLIGTSDVHYLKDLNKTYSLIHAEKNIESIFESIRNSKVKLVSNPFGILEFTLHTFNLFIKDK